MSSKETLSIALGVAIVFVSVAAAFRVHSNEQELASAQIDVGSIMFSVGNLKDLTPAEAY